MTVSVRRAFDQPPLSLPEALALLRQQLCQRSTVVQGIQQLRYRITDTDPLSWLQQQKVPQRVYWADRDQAQQLAGMGQALYAQGSFSEVAVHLEEWKAAAPPHIWFLGGSCFDETDDASSRLRAGFVLPQLMLQRTPEGTFLVAHRVCGLRGVPPNLPLLELLDHVQFLENAAPPAALSVQERCDFPNETEWKHAVTRALELIRSRDCQKVVLARETRLQLNQQPDPFFLLDELRHQSARAFHFGWQWDSDTAFVSITPERLFRRQGQHLESEAIAGTRPRGSDQAEDEQLWHDLSHDTKEVREHLMVLRFLEERFAAHCTHVERLSRLEALQLSHVQHLQSRIRGILREDVSDAAILAALHPTPAVCGLPQARARMHIRELEGFDRGWYAGPIGCVSPQYTEFAVGIRSGLLHGDKLTIYAGAGIVEGSEPEREWQELEHKLRNWNTLLHLQP
jgi:menaquinone-specific isochorismate synthase